MGIYDRDHRQNDPWKKNKTPNSEQFNFNESKFNDRKTPHFSHNYKSHINHENEDIRNFNQAADARRKLKEFKQVWRAGEQIGSKQNSYPIVPWLLALTVILFIANLYNKTHHTKNIPDTVVPTVTNITLPLPPTSVLSTSYDPASATCPFTLIADNKNYYIKICDTLRGDQTIAKFFIRAGEELTTTIPAGNYKIKFGSGNDWYGEEELFGPYSQYGESENLNFIYDGYVSNGHTISFYKAVNGNFHTNTTGRDAVLKN